MNDCGPVDLCVLEQGRAKLVVRVTLALAPGVLFPEAYLSPEGALLVAEYLRGAPPRGGAPQTGGDTRSASAPGTTSASARAGCAGSPAGVGVSPTSITRTMSPGRGGERTRPTRLWMFCGRAARARARIVCVR